MSSSQPKFTMLLVDSDEDVIIVTAKSCLTCAEQKLGLKILKKWSIDTDEVKKLRPYLSRNPLRIKCICNRR